MGYIKFNITKRCSNEEGVPMQCSIRRLESDMAGTSMYDTNIIMHALSIKGITRQDGFPYFFPIILGNNGFAYDFPISFG